MKYPVRMTYSTAAVLVALDAGFEYGFDIAVAIRQRRGTTYPILRRLEESGLVVGAWEPTATARAEGRPPRRYYRLTQAGHRMAADAAEAFPMVRTLAPAGGRRS